ncbi:MAG: hypothetical protein GXO43_07340 [Crenarchaeota archaeon]|nr:hypothetical protein [Thermoproteota archaeon]
MKIISYIQGFLVREKLLVLLLAIFIAFIVFDHSLVERIPSYVNLDAIIVITSLLVISRCLHVSGLTNRIAAKILGRTGGSPRSTLFYILLITYLLAPLIMNDGAIFVVVPLVMVIAELSGHEEALLVTLVAVSANMASIILPIGNPQDIVIWTHYGIPFTEYILASLPLYLVSLGLLAVYIMFLSKKLILKEIPVLPRVRLDEKLAVASLVSLIAIIITAQLKAPWIGLVITIILVLLSRPHILVEIDYPLIAVFILMFIDFSEIPHLLRIQSLISMLSPLQIYGLSLVLSQGISNVPATIALIRHTIYWKALFAGVNIGGVGLLPGSMANIIALRLSRTSVRDYHRYALPFFLVMSMVGFILVLVGLYS